MFVLSIVSFVLLGVSALLIFYAMVGYPIFLLLINKFKKPKSLQKDSSYEPTITYMIVAHNEEKVINNKLNNILSFDYPLNKIQVLIASDFCSDSTDAIVEKFIKEHSELDIVLNKSKEHKGKTNAQNETQKLATGEILVMTDANSMFDKSALRELVSAFTSESIVYVCGRLIYTNDNNSTANSESTYWNFDLKQREIESNIQTITAGNGSIYAVRNKEYVDIDPIECHDGAFPRIYALKRKRSLFNPEAIAYEKAGETNEDEFKRKVRMNRSILDVFTKMWRPLNIFKCKWYSVFYFGHRVCRYLLWFNHIVFFIASILLTISGYYILGGVLIGSQLIVLILGLISINHRISFKPLRLIGYYSMTVIAQTIGAFKQATGQSKPVWKKAESTR